MLRTNLTRSDLRPICRMLSSNAAMWTNTREASPTEMLVPMPMLVFDMKSTGVMISAGSTPVRQAIPKASQKPPLGRQIQDEPPLPPTTNEEPHEAADEKELGAEAEQRPASEPATDPVAKRELGTRLEADHPGQAARAHIHRIELSIDSLPHLQLSAPIPVTTASLGENLFTATVHALNLSGTGDSATDALITVKEQIEALYEKLTKLTGLDEEESDHLQFLKSHIKSGDESSKHKRGIWR